MSTTTYQKDNRESIEAHGRRLVKGTLRTNPGVRDAPEHALSKKVTPQTKGLLGRLVEEYFYDIHPKNTECSPDFVDAKVELKTTPLERRKRKGIVPKERLSLGMIDYWEVHKERFDVSCFMQKNRALMVLWYLHESEKEVGDLRFLAARLINLDTLPEADRVIIEEDWEFIASRVRSGEAHLLGRVNTPTRYLEAVTKGAPGARKNQPFSSEPARPRAFAFKETFIKGLLEGEFGKNERLFDSGAEVAAAGFEAAIENRFKPFLGMSEVQIATSLEVTVSSSKKDYRATLARAIMGVRTKRIVELDRADIELKAIHHRPGKPPKQHISFPAFRYMGPKSLLDEVWDVGDEEEEGERVVEIRRLLERRFLFVIFEEDDGVSRLADVQFWTMPEGDIEMFVEPVWERSRRAVETGNLSLFPKVTHNYVCHVRPHATKGETFPTPHNGDQTKRCFWLDSRYVASKLGFTGTWPPSQLG